MESDFPFLLARSGEECSAGAVFFSIFFIANCESGVETNERRSKVNFKKNPKNIENNATYTIWKNLFLRRKMHPNAFIQEHEKGNE